ncbi:MULTISPECIES: fibronectin type III domain-containing protein [Bacillus]|uniref:fibronectin type III domain-containing protein n=1 Tax=Bacillus TaxID=1386 RepID=UPI0015827042|nr:fibronectin type III domain-containing protein [Bacillus glycinifermentans]MBU8787141.1 fibronectin type III domain-containing protein [Bacillus glycinifermentans]NUJ16162.1 fibronectin type III domain-containing protein [Bacillus glycinifermentans]
MRSDLLRAQKNSCSLGKKAKLHPNAPQNLSFTATTDSVTVKWEPVDGATSYNVYRGADKKLDATVTGTSHTLTGIAPDTKLTVNVSAVNSAGESPMTEIETRTKPAEA